MNSVSVFAPASVANVACGFDIFGFALDNPGDKITITKKEEPGINLTIEGEGKDLPTDPKKNTATFGILEMVKDYPIDFGLEVELIKDMPNGSGLGSSGVSAAAALVAFNELIGSPLKRKDLLPYGTRCEAMASGSAHADNVAASILGGFVLVQSYEPLNVIKLTVSVDLWCTVLHPNTAVMTKDARSMLNKSVELKHAVEQWGNVAGLTAGLINGNYDLIKQSLKDVVIEPQRSKLISGFQDIKNAALEAGALGSSIAGSGPSIFALSRNCEEADQIGAAMLKACSKNGIEGDIYVSRINDKGARVLKVK